MNDPRLEEVLRLLSPAPGSRLWFGGATVLGSLRGVTHEEAAWTPATGRHGIWELTLHIAYWKYAVRRTLEGSPKGRFPRSPANWPRLPDPAGAAAWKADRALLRQEHESLLATTRAFDPRRLDDEAPGSGDYRYLDLLFGVATHDIHHVAQIQLLKRLVREAA